MGNWTDLVKRIFKADQGSNDEKKARLLGALHEPEFSVMKKLLTDQERTDPTAKVETLLDQFSQAISQSTLESNMSLFQARKQHAHETPLTFSLELKRLCSLAFPNLLQETADQIILHKFLEGLAEPLRSKVQLSVPGTLQAAINNALKLDKPSLRVANVEMATRGQQPPPLRARDLRPTQYRSPYPANRNIRPKYRQNDRQMDRQNDRQMDRQNDRQMDRQNDRPSDKGTRPPLMRFPKPNEPPRGPRMLPQNRDPQNQGAPKPKKEVKCFNCGENHFVRNCTKPKNS